MKIFAFLSCLSVAFAAFTDVTGDLAVTYNSATKQVVIKGELSSLPKDISGGIHVHEGTDCGDSKTIGLHLYSKAVDGWLKTQYSTDGDGGSTIDVSTAGYALEAEGAGDRSVVAGRCIVLHGASDSDIGTRVAIGKIEKKDGKYIATITKYPGSTVAGLNPTGRITVTVDKISKVMNLKGVVNGLARNVPGLGIHIHTGTDCTKADAVGGHLLYRGDGFLKTTYTSDTKGVGQVNIATPGGAYTLLNKDEKDAGPTAVEDHCIVVHNDAGARISTGKIKCGGDGKCKASFAPYPKPVVPIKGELTVALVGGVLKITGDIVGLPRGKTDGRIHVHTGTDCTNAGYADALDISAHIGNHLYSNNIDGWAFPKPTTYDTDANGETTINVKASKYVLAASAAKLGMPSVQNRCIVLHGLSASAPGDRVAIAKIVASADGVFTAKVGKYPGPNDLKTVPEGVITLTERSGQITLTGKLKGLGKSLDKAGIHIHTGTDCTGGSDKSSKAKVNAVIGGHLNSNGDGFLETSYKTNINGEGSIDVGTPKDSYTLRTATATDKVPAVEGRCIVVHDDGSTLFARVGIAKVVCDDATGVCKATVGPYPKPVGPLSGVLKVTKPNAKTILISGTVEGAPRDVARAGIHVHEGTDCADKDAIGNHLYTNTIDGWLSTTYNTDAKGETTVLVNALNYALDAADDVVGRPAVEGRCIVMHGSEASDGERVAIGKIVKKEGSFTAVMGKYPGPASSLKSTPSGTITVTPNGKNIQLTGKISGLAPNLEKVGIHVHTGDACNGGPDTSTLPKVNAVIGGHLLSRGDGFLATYYSSTRLASAKISVAPPSGSYTLLEADEAKDKNGPAAVENHCIVMHGKTGARVGVGKIVCKGTSCEAIMGPYPTKSATKPTAPPTTTTAIKSATKATTVPPTAKPSPTTEKTTAKDNVDSAVTNMLSMCAIVVYCMISL